MIDPAGTTWPANALTPRRLLSESRPLRLVPAPFLWAMPLLLGALESDRVDRQLGETTAMTLRLLERALRLVREDLDLLAEEVLADRRLDLRVLGRIGVVRTLGVAHRECVERDALALFGVDAVDDDGV